MGDELQVEMLAERIGTFLLELMPEKTTLLQLRGLQVEMTTAATNYCSENHIPNNVFATD